MAAAPETVRVDSWIWAVRLLKTRSAATEACRGGHVKVNGTPAKPSAPVRVGDEVAVRVHQRDVVVEVVRLIDKRVGPPVAAECLVDHSPPPPPREPFVPVFERVAGAGRPTKRDRRRMNQLRSD
ncbi:MAG TPA: RNA-binding S4 domain-containing protein [Acidimicrobiales bacterium]|nr:RNA-binding S4 domain-containing protein [Acidimicrobiales bacterium]